MERPRQSYTWLFITLHCISSGHKDWIADCVNKRYKERHSETGTTENDSFVDISIFDHYNAMQGIIYVYPAFVTQSRTPEHKLILQKPSSAETFSYKCACDEETKMPFLCINIIGSGCY